MQLGFADGTELEVDAVIWATGYRPDHSWIETAAKDAKGSVRHRRGVTDVPGLYFLGLSWQYTRGSALLGWVKDDAAFIAAQIAAERRDDARPGVATSQERLRAPRPAVGAREEDLTDAEARPPGTCGHRTITSRPTAWQAWT